MKFCSMHVADITVDKDQYWSYAAYLYIAYIVPTLHTLGWRVNKVKYYLKKYFFGQKLKNPHFSQDGYGSKKEHR